MVGVNVMTPVEVFNVYTPPVTETVVAVHEDGDWPAEHNLAVDGESIPTPAVSFVNTSFDCVTLT